MNAELDISPRELEVIVLVVDGLTNAEIGARLGITVRTVQAHVARIMAKTDTRSRTHLAVVVLRAGIVPLHPESPQ